MNKFIDALNFSKFLVQICQKSFKILWRVVHLVTLYVP